MLAAFADLGITDDLADITVTSLEKYVGRLFYESGNLNSLKDAKWSMYTKQQDCDNLPPTKVVLKFEVSRSHLMSDMEIVSFAIFKVLWSNTLGWKTFWDVSKPILTDESPASEVVIEMSLTKCNTDCSTMRCKCKKNSLVCTKMCLYYCWRGFGAPNCIWWRWWR